MFVTNMYETKKTGNEETVTKKANSEVIFFLYSFSSTLCYVITVLRNVLS